MISIGNSNVNITLFVEDTHFQNVNNYVITIQGTYEKKVP